jgi:hypothetical protein
MDVCDPAFLRIVNSLVGAAGILVVVGIALFSETFQTHLRETPKPRHFSPVTLLVMLPFLAVVVVISAVYAFIC